MKCDKFTTPVKIEIPGIGTIESKDLLLKAEVDEAIAELKAQNERLREDKDFTEYAERTDNQISEMDYEIRRLRKENAELREENEDLKNELYAVKTDLAMATRWRKVDDDFPTANEGHFWVLWEDGLPDVGYIGAEDDVIETEVVYDKFREEL